MAETAQTTATTEAHGGAHEAHPAFLGLDSYGWVAIAFATFVAILWKLGAFKAIGAALDARAAKVRADLAEAAMLKAEAEALRAQAAADAAQAEKDAAAIVAGARREAELVLANAETAADAAIARRTKLAEDRIAAAQRAAEGELRARAAQLAAGAARDILAAKAANGELAPLTDEAIAKLG
ncbi:F0F1 ATP synthase subunit B family protein [Sandaracinobacteroides saxicola]|uniref:ATP synthase subunit b n=1 Tax=Sandaracinobacteroides saxicola TaxID=2759707 RepID=A0A7G5IDV6_9SPHN|nr:hypothetical protein [Sandaracinobacteroides saxicola]QMW21548.1 hypothetical protein H3309_08925 [Sandaracinobacteroides saxicola]